MLCGWSVQPGETYWRQAALDEGTAWTNKTCEHCERVVHTYCRAVGESDWMEEDALEWLEDEYPDVLATLRAGWRYPDGQKVPAPFESRCFDCGTRIEFRRLWCRECDEKRLARIGEGFANVAAEFARIAADSHSKRKQRGFSTDHVIIDEIQQFKQTGDDTP